MIGDIADALKIVVIFIAFGGSSNGDCIVEP